MWASIKNIFGVFIGRLFVLLSAAKECQVSDAVLGLLGMFR